MKKKVLIAVGVVLLAVVAFFTYKYVIQPETQKGAKEVTIEVVNEKENVNEVITLNTDAEFLYDLLMENEESLGVTIEEQSFGPFLSGMKNYVANADDKEFFSIAINGEDAMVGIKEIPVKSGETYRFELKTW